MSNSRESLPHRLRRRDINRVDFLSYLAPEGTYLNPELIELDRLSTRPPPDPSITYDFFEAQDPESRLFPLEKKLCDDLIESCRKNGMSEGDINKIQPAIALSLYGHQRQWRLSGHPYIMHTFETAQDLVESYKKPDWQTIALSLLHDLPEDSPHYGHEVKTSWVLQIYKSLGLEEEGRVLVRSMEAMKKVAVKTLPEKISAKATEIFRRGRKSAAVQTVRKLYDTLVRIDGTEFGDERVILVKLHERKHNMKTIRFQPPEKQFAIANATLQIYVNMAGAFNLHKLKGELALYSLEVLYPDLIARLKEQQLELIAIEEELDNNGIVAGYYKMMEDFPAASWWYDRASPYLIVSVPSIYELFAASREDKDYRPYLNYRLIIPELDGETDQSWKNRAFACYQVLSDRSLIDEKPKRDIAIGEVGFEESPGRLPDAIVTIKGVDVRIEIVSDKRLIADHASIANLFTDSPLPVEIGTLNEWRLQARRNLAALRERFLEARETGDLSTFFETVAGEKVIYDEHGHTHHFPEETTVLDVIYQLKARDAFRIGEVHVGRGNSVVILKGEGFYQKLETGDRIAKTVATRELQISPDWLGNVVVDSVRNAFEAELERLAESNEGRREALRIRGEQVIQTRFNQYWDLYLAENKISREHPENVYLIVPLRYVASTYADEYASDAELTFNTGLNKVPTKKLEEIVREMVEFRSRVVYLQVDTEDVEGATASVLDILKELGINNLRALGEAQMRSTGKVYVWFPEVEIGGETPQEKWQYLQTIVKRLPYKPEKIKIIWKNTPQKLH